MDTNDAHDTHARVNSMSRVVHLSEQLLRWMSVNVRVILHEIDLFLGVIFLTIGLFSFESDKYCDGNTAEYLSCTRPSTFYFFDSLDIFLITLGVFFVLIWFLKDRASNR